ncbi:hypothetical protein AINA4_00020 [Aurantimicrobium sp. INA4]|nr:hypothetical protein AINA4_00020 [Aurantimicrobium sp. INA4]
MGNTHTPNTTYADVVSSRYMEFVELYTISTGVKKIKELFKCSLRFNNLYGPGLFHLQKPR